MQRKRISKKMVECIKSMQDQIQFCVKWKHKEVSEPIKLETGIQGHCCGSYLSNIFTNSIIAYISNEKPHVQPVEKPVLLPADNSATKSLCGIQRRIRN
jgi:hypothetical protein